MRWMLGAVVVLAILGVVLYALFVPPTSGPGWRLDPDARWGRALVPDDLAPTVVIYDATDAEIGFGITVYGSSSCPPRIRNVEVEDGVISVRASADISWFLTGCSADAAPHEFGIRVDRDLISLPATVIVQPDELPAGIGTFESLPEG
jgi:hypothetical protein